MSNMPSVGGAPAAPSAPSMPAWMSGSTTPPLPNETPSLPGSLKTASTLPKTPTVKPPKPLYEGPHINSIPHTANALGAHYRQYGSLYTVNGNRVRPIAYKNGTPHAPVGEIAHAAGYPSTHVNSTTQTTTVMPHDTASQPYLREGSNGSAVRNLQQELMQMGYNVGSTGADGIYGKDTYNAVRQFQTDHHLGRDGIVGPQTWAALNSYQNAAPKHSTAASSSNSQAPAPSSAPAQPTDPFTQIMNNAPTPPPAVQMPGAPSVSPFQWDGQQAYNSAYNQLAPTYMNQMSMADQRLNAGLNNRGIFNSGIAQQMQNQQDQGIYDKLDNAAMTQANSNEKTAFDQWNTQVTQTLNDYKDQIQSAYDQGQLDDKTYATLVQQWNDAATRVADMQKAMLPYTMGPTPQQQITDSLSQQKLQAQIDQWAAQDKLKAEDIAQTGAIAQAKLNAQLARDAELTLQAAQTASDKEKATQLTGLHEQLVAAGNYLKNLQATNPNDKADIKKATDNYNNIMNAITKVVNSMGTANP